MFELPEIDKNSRSFVDRSGTDRDGDLMPAKQTVPLADHSEDLFVDRISWAVVHASIIADAQITIAIATIVQRLN